jgi:hypothetical protein
MWGWGCSCHHPRLASTCSCHAPHFHQWLGAGAGSFVPHDWAYLAGLSFVIAVLPLLLSSACSLQLIVIVLWRVLGHACHPVIPLQFLPCRWASSPSLLHLCPSPPHKQLLMVAVSVVVVPPPLRRLLLAPLLPSQLLNIPPCEQLLAAAVGGAVVGGGCRLHFCPPLAVLVVLP